ncbi:MAG: hypothetical protein ACI9H8_000028 [Lysobacterales bacterium]|jgi:hypothetical protein
MIDERIIELLYAKLDGELSQSDQLELNDAIQGSIEVRELQKSLIEFSDLLEQEPSLEIPDGLHAKIVSQIHLPVVARGFRFSEIPGFFRYGLAAAAGLILTVGLYESQLNNTDAQDISSMVGTIMQKDGSSKAVTLDAFAFEFDSISSAVSLQRRDGALVLDVLLDSRDPVDITVDFTSDGLKFDAIAQMQSDLKSIEFADQAIHIEGTGRQHFAVLLHRDGDLTAEHEASIKLRFTSNGKLIKEGSLVTR